MNGLIQDAAARRPTAHLSQFGMTTLHLRNPWVIVFWSFALPGCGSIVQGKVMKGLLLVIWELVINTSARVNLAILYSLTGRFDRAIHVINSDWFLLYAPVYVYAMWDSYRGTVDLNQHAMLAAREDVPIPPIALKSLDTNILNRQSPWYAAALSAMTPGLGHLYVHKVAPGLFFITWTILAVYLSHILQAVHATMTGNFVYAKSIVDMQWLMYIPSIYGFVLYDAYATAVEHNRLFETAQSRFLRQRYQKPDFIMP